MTDWSRAVERATSSRAVLVIGRPDTGKTTFFRTVWETAKSKRTVGFIDGDLGQKTIGPPCTIGLEIPLIHRSIFFVGDTTPATRPLEAALGVARLQQEARDLGCKTIVVDTSGLAEGGLGARLKLAKAELLRADLAIVFQQGNELESLTAALKAIGLAVMELRVSGKAKRTSPAERAENRRLAYLRYFGDAVPVEVSLTDVALFPADTGKPWPAGLLVGLEGALSTLAMGMLIKLRDESVTLLAPRFSLEKLRLIKPGRIVLRSDGSELGRF